MEFINILSGMYTTSVLVHSIKITKATREAKIILKKPLQNANIDSFRCTKRMKDSNLIENTKKLIVICNIYVFTNF
jgi:hypothetical protein